MPNRARWLTPASLFLFALCSAAGSAEPVAVRFTEGLVHGFLTLRTLDGALVANGDLIQRAQGDRDAHAAEEHIGARAPLPAVSMVVATPKPRLVKLELSSAGDEPFTTGSAARKAVHYVVKIDIGGLAGLVAPLVGKQPPDTHVWILGGEAPASVKSEGAMFLGGPLWRIELTNPVWPR